MWKRTSVWWSCVAVVSVSVLWIGVSIVGVRPADGPVTAVAIVSPGPKDVATALAIAGTISPAERYLFPWYVRFRGVADDMHPGIFLVPKNAPLRDVVRILLQRSRAETRVTIPEGSSLRDLAEILQKNGLVASADLVFAVTGTPAKEKTSAAFSEGDFSFLLGRPSNSSLEGYLFPDTYRFFSDATVRDIAEKMLETFDRKTADLRSEPIPYPLQSFYDVLTLASVVEAEVRGIDDQRRVADLFLRRLARGMPLQADSTVQYASGAGGRFTPADDRASQNPWNTYQHPGLPRGPIASPGLDALRAVLHPIPNDALYFLTAPDGTVYYAKTFEGHVANKRHL
jgi:UPF0755 protein